MNTLSHTTFQIAICLIFFFLLILSLIFPFRTKNSHIKTLWISVKSWLVLAPLIIICIGSGSMPAAIILTCIALLGAREFLKIVGMYHKNSFVWTIYTFLCCLSAAAFTGEKQLYHILPTVFLGLSPLIIIIKGSTKQSIQFISLSLLAILLVGWCFLHSIWIVFLPNGAIYLIYLFILTELSDHTNIIFSKFLNLKRQKSTKFRTTEGLFVAILITLIAGYLMKFLLPSSLNWQSLSLVAVLVGNWGCIFWTMICKDLGIKERSFFIMDHFIVGRGGILDRLCHFIFTTPIYYYLIS